MSEEKLPQDGLEEDYEPDIITLEDETGKEHTFEVLDAADIDDVRYLAMVPYSEDPTQRLAADAEMLIMRLCDEGDGEYLDIVEDPDELYAAGQVFMNRLSEVFDIDLDELNAELSGGE